MSAFESGSPAGERDLGLVSGSRSGEQLDRLSLGILPFTLKLGNSVAGLSLENFALLCFKGCEGGHGSLNLQSLLQSIDHDLMTFRNQLLT